MSSSGVGRDSLNVKKEEEIKKWLEQFGDDNQDQIEALISRLVSVETENGTLRLASDEHQKSKTCMNLMAKKLERNESLLSKTEMAKSKLETLCRELQKQNREIKEQNVERLKLMDRSRQDMIDQFKGSLANIQQSVDAGKERSSRLAGDNEHLASKLKELAMQYEEKLKCLSEQYEHKQNYADQLGTAKDLELQLVKAKLEAATLHMQEMSSEKEKIQLLLKDRDQIVEEALASEKSLREQISRYSDKYNDLHKSLSVSNDAFDRFKKEMERMNSTLIKVQRESHKWKQQYEESTKLLVDLKTAKKKSDEEVALKQRQLTRLEQLCRTLQNGWKGKNAPPTEDVNQANEPQASSSSTDSSTVLCSP